MPSLLWWAGTAVACVSTVTFPTVGQIFEGLRAMLPSLLNAAGKAPLSGPEEFKLEMSAAGSSEVTIQTIRHSVTTPSFSEYWETTQRSTASIALLRNRLGEERWAEVASSVFHRFRETLGDGPVEEFYAIHLGVGVK